MISKPSAPIGIFDSGIGGLTVVQSLRERLPKELLCYFGDTARVPYGTKSADTVKRYSLEIANFLKSHHVKIIVVACNTVSSVALDAVADFFTQPVLGVVEPGVQAAIQTTRNGRIGVIGTKSTIRSGAYQNRLKQHDKALYVVSQACPLFVPLAEEGWENDPITFDIAKRYLTPLVESNLDTVILGCTHYPLLTNVIQQVMGESVTLVSSADEVSREVAATLERMDAFAREKTCKDLFYASDDIAGFQALYQKIFGDTHASFIEASSGFFTIVQEAYRYPGRVFADPVQWFDSIEK